MLEQNGNAVSDRVSTPAFIALEALLPPQNQRLAADGANENFEQVRGDRHGAIVAKSKGR